MARPTLRIVRGDPSEDELAALLAVLVATSRADDGSTSDPRPTTWAAYWRGLRRPNEPGPGAWQRSTWPR